MDLFEKIDELRAMDVTPEEFEAVNGVSKEEALRKVTEFVDKFRKAKAARNSKKTVRLEAVPKAAAAAIELDSAAIPAAATPASAERVASGKKRRTTATSEMDKIIEQAMKIAKQTIGQNKAAKATTPKRGRAAKALGEIIKVKLKDGVVEVKPEIGIGLSGIEIIDGPKGKSKNKMAESKIKVKNGLNGGKK